MTEPLPDTWHSRDLPVLRTVVRLWDEQLLPLQTSEIERALPDLDPADIERALVALRSAGLIEGKGAWGAQILRVSDPTAEARRLSGAWPSADSIADRLLAALEDIAEYGSDEATKSKARKALDGLGGFSRDVLVGVISSAAGVAMQ